MVVENRFCVMPKRVPLVSQKVAVNPIFDSHVHVHAQVWVSEEWVLICHEHKLVKRQYAPLFLSGTYSLHTFKIHT